MQATSEKIILNSGRNVTKYILKNHKGMEVEVISIGATLTKITAPDKDGNYENVILGWQDLNVYEQNPGNFGAIIGRIAGRVFKGTVTIADKEYHLPVNNFRSTLHGGNKGFHVRDWQGEMNIKEDSVSLVMYYLSKDGEEGFPGNLKVKVTYTLKDDNSLTLDYEAETDQETIVNLTNHAYFNLSGEAKRDILGHELCIKSDEIYDLDEELIPTGKLIKLDQEPIFDFREPKCIGQDINKENRHLKNGSGYDHLWKLNTNENAINLYDSISKRNMFITTSEPGVVVYTMNHADNPMLLSNGKLQEIHYAVCLETQKPAIGYNEQGRQAVILKPGEIYTQHTMFKFTVK
ncbi:MAG: aldose epimerase family protein [Cellulosilyticum sp.]|nr:galactose mutarotase [Cellulosilyticum sp.]MEE1071807.1 aldose epimerase family protein [Cellulosilyticum sp.]